MVLWFDTSKVVHSGFELKCPGTAQISIRVVDMAQTFVAYMQFFISVHIQILYNTLYIYMLMYSENDQLVGVQLSTHHFKALIK